MHACLERGQIQVGLIWIADPQFDDDAFDHRAFYAAEAGRLAAAGL